MLAFLVVDAQNEFSSKGQRVVPDHAAALARIETLVRQARELKLPIAWVQHHNRPNESRAFVRGSWGAELSPGLGPQSGVGPEKLFVKDVFGAFGAAGLEEWLRSNGVTQVLVAGFFTHMCVSTSSREALVRQFEVFIDPQATATHALEDPILGKQSADEVRRSALLQLQDMGVVVSSEVLQKQAATVGKG
jgi:nicotinamidase-related amidase